MLTPHYQDENVTVYAGDCLEVLKQLPECSVDSVCTDPPYGLEFMGKDWDAPWQESDVNADAGFHGGGISATRKLPSYTGSTNPKCLNCKGTRRGRRDGTAKVRVCLCPDGGEFPNYRAVEMRAFQQWCQEWASECLRVLKPGGHLVAFGGTRTWHRLACAIEDAGFEVRDSIAWLYGSGFPKSASIYKQTIKTLEERYGSARCDCLDPRDGQSDRDGVGRESWPAARTSREPGEVSANKAGAANVSVEQGGDLSGVRELWQSDTQEAEGSTAVEEPVLLAGVRERGAEEARRGHASVRGRLEGNSSQDSEQGQGLSVLRKDTGGKRQSVACASPDPVQVRGDQPVGESGGPVRLVPSSDRGADQRGIGVDPGRSEPRRVISDSESGWSKANAKVCSWCGLPDADWLASLEPLGTALKPAFEPVVVARKPLAGTVAANVLEHGTGALNIDGCRIDTNEVRVQSPQKSAGATSFGGVRAGGKVYDSGRWPTNVVLDEAAAAEVDRQSGWSKSRASTVSDGRKQTMPTAAMNPGLGRHDPSNSHTDSGGASRFFPVFRYEAKADSSERPSVNGVQHPTVKPLKLARWLVRLVTPPGGVVLDPFAGSGTTAEACIHEHKRCIAIEREADYLPLITARLTKPMEVGFDFGEDL